MLNYRIFCICNLFCGSLAVLISLWYCLGATFILFCTDGWLKDFKQDFLFKKDEWLMLMALWVELSSLILLWKSVVSEHFLSILYRIPYIDLSPLFRSFSIGTDTVLNIQIANHLQVEFLLWSTNLVFAFLDTSQL